MRRLLAVAAALLWATPALAIGTINIANAPGWQGTHAYTLADRVVAGAGWNGTAYTSGQPLCLFGLTVAGTSGSSASAFNTACASGTPAAVGGGLDGTIPAGWSGAATVTDGGATWALLTRVDYVTITGFNCDDARTYATSTTYNHIDQVVTAAGHCYSENNTFGGSIPCSSTTTPTGTTFNASITDNTCRWYYQGDVTYTSQANRWPHQLWNGAGGYNQQYTQDIVVQLWYGGAQRTYYGPLQPGEMSPLQIHYHADSINDSDVFCIDGVTPKENCKGTGVGQGGYTTTISPASGDRWRDNCPVASCPARYDETKGVAIFTDAAVPDLASIALSPGDSNVIYDSLQIQSVHGDAVPSTPGDYTFGPSNNGWTVIRNSIVMAGGTPFSCDLNCVIENSIVISSSTTSGVTLFHNKHQGMAHDNTFICSGGSGDIIAVMDMRALTGVGAPPWPLKSNNLVLGCSTPYASGVPGTNVGANNATDISSAPTGTFVDIYYGVDTVTRAYMDGTTLTGITPANQLVNPTVGGSFDARVKNTGADIYAAGGAFTFSQTGYKSMAFYSPVTPGTDVYGTTRPISARYDIGAAMFVATGTCTISSVSLSGPHTFLGGSTSGTVVGTMSASTSGTCASNAWSITSTGSDHSSTSCNASSGTDFQAVGTSLELNTTLAAGSYAGICYTNTISGAVGSPFTQAVTIIGTSPTGPVKGGKARGGLWH